MRLERHSLENQYFEPFIRPALCLDLLSPGVQYRQCRGGVSPGQVDPRLADRELMRLSQMSRRRQIALAEQGQHLCGTNVTHPKNKIVLEQERFGLIQNSDRAGNVSLSKPQPGEKHRIRQEGVDAFYPARQLEALLPVLFGSIQVVSFVRDTRQAK